MMKKTVSRKTYGSFMSSLYYIYLELEEQLQKYKGANTAVNSIDDDCLRRLDNIREDLSFFYGDKWLDILPSPSLWTIRYASRINDISEEPHRLLVHHWARYGAGLAGGQFLRTTIESCF